MQFSKTETKAKAVLLFANNNTSKATAQLTTTRGGKQRPRRLDENKCVLLRGPNKTVESV